MAMRRVGAYDAKTHLSQLLEEVAEGKSITITKHGHAVAKLTPPDRTRADPGVVIRELRAFRQGITLGELSVRELIEEGRA